MRKEDSDLLNLLNLVINDRRQTLRKQEELIIDGVAPASAKLLNKVAKKQAKVGLKIISKLTSNALNPEEIRKAATSSSEEWARHTDSKVA